MKYAIEHLVKGLMTNQLESKHPISIHEKTGSETSRKMVRLVYIPNGLRFASL